MSLQTNKHNKIMDIKINYTISIEGNVYLLCPKNNEDYYEVYTHSNDEMHGQYLGDFETANKLDSLEFEREFTAWIRGEEYIPYNNVEDVLAELMEYKCTALYDDKGTKCYRSSKCHRNCAYFINALNQIKNN